MALARWRDAGLAGGRDLRPVPEAALHVTLAFLGARPEDEVEAVAACGLGAIEGLPAPVLAPAEVRALPRRGPRLLALALRDEGGRAAAVQAAISEALSQAGLFEPEARAFWPHLTLVRVRGGGRGGGRVAPLALLPPPARRLALPAATLYRSHLSPRGARYEPLARRELPPGTP